MRWRRFLGGRRYEEESDDGQAFFWYLFRPFSTLNVDDDSDSETLFVVGIFVDDEYSETCCLGF